MIMVDSGDFELNRAPGLHMNRRGRVLILLCYQFDDLRVLALCHDGSGLRNTKGERHGKRR
jgi:hypothetical protein